MLLSRAEIQQNIPFQAFKISLIEFEIHFKLGKHCKYTVLRKIEPYLLKIHLKNLKEYQKKSLLITISIVMSSILIEKKC